MENASKALLIAGGMLLMMLLLSLSAYLFRRMSDSTQGIYAELTDSEISEFNQKFLNYENKDNLNAQDVISIINLAKNSNKEEKHPITVEVQMADGNDLLNTELGKFLNENIGNIYTCKVEFGENSRLVGKVIITKIDNY